MEVSNAQEALAYIGAANLIDLVFSDIRMPGHLDGIALAKRLKSTHPSPPVILTSADLGPMNVEDMATFIQKPYRHAQVIARVMEKLELRSPNEPDK